MHVCMYVCMYVCMNVRIYVYVYVCMFVCMYVSIERLGPRKTLLNTVNFHFSSGQNLTNLHPFFMA